MSNETATISATVPAAVKSEAAAVSDEPMVQVETRA